MPVPSSINDLSPTPALNSPAGSEPPSSTDDYLRSLSAFIKQVNDAPVTTARLANVSVTADKLADNAVTADKLEATAVIKVLQAAYPIGSIYINAASATNPATLLGFGTWVAFGSGRVIVGQDTGDASFDLLEETGGSKNAIVVSHSHTLTGTTNTTGAHQHGVGGGTFGAGGGGAFASGSTESVLSTSAGDHAHTVSGTANTTGTSGVNANLQPYIVVRMWKRTV